MEDDSDSNGWVEGDDNNSESDRSDEEGSERSFVEDSSGEYDDDDTPQYQFNRLMENLQNQESHELDIDSSEVFELIFEDIGEFCRHLATASDSLTCVKFGISEMGRDVGMLHIAQSQQAAWNQFCRAIKDLGTLKECVLGYDIFGIPTMIEVLGSMPKVEILRVCLECRDVRGREVDALLHAISASDIEKVAFALNDHESAMNDMLSMMRSNVAASLATINVPGHTHAVNEHSNEANLSDSSSHLYVYGATLSRIIHVNKLSELHLSSLSLSLEDCTSLVEHLTSRTCTLEGLKIDDCKFATEGGQQIASAFSQNKSLTNLSLAGFQDEAFRSPLLSSLPANTSIESLRISTGMLMFPGKETFIVDLFSNLCRHNETIKKLDIFDLFLSSYLATGERKDELENAVKQNYTLESITIGVVGSRSPFQPILRLNRAGRRYLIDDASSRSRCIAVLAKVKHDLDCLYFHMRENPILCMNGGSTGEPTSEKKRKADDSEQLIDLGSEHS